ncbi:MAG: ABC transporter ATP-binding protein [Candidatus Promineifilaceae bacterium]
MTALVEVREAVVQRAGRDVLMVPWLALVEGETLSLIGPNGAGKSTLLLLLAGLVRPSRGEVCSRGRPLDQEGRLAYRRRLALVLQEPLLLDRSAFDNVALGLRFRRLGRAVIRQRAAEWLARFGVAHLASRPARELSGGEAQRVSLARAFALEPELLLLDEPFSALDAPTRGRLRADFQAILAGRRVTTLFVTHDLDEALQLGDRVGVMLAGRLRQICPPAELLAAPTDADVAAFIGQAHNDFAQI